jgi:hypothetical protein
LIHARQDAYPNNKKKKSEDIKGEDERIGEDVEVFGRWEQEMRNQIALPPYLLG